MFSRKKLGLFLGPSAFVFLLFCPVPDGMEPIAMKAIAVSVFMAVFWITEAVSIFATSFIPVVLFPLLGVLDANQIGACYGHYIVLLILGAFFVAKAIETNNLHKRIALATIRTIGTSRPKIMLSFMIATGCLSMWTSNNSTTLMMLPIGLAILSREKKLGSDISGFAPALMLSIAYSASIGGTGTLVGTPPNLIFVSTVQEVFPGSPTVLFADWLKIGIPFMVVFMPISWIYLVKFFRVSGNLHGSFDLIEQEHRDMGPMSKAEKKVTIIIVLYAMGFIFRTWWSGMLGVDAFTKDSTVAFIAALVLFALPSGRKNKAGKETRLLEWQDAKEIPWGIAMMIGGGLAIASSFKSSGVVEWMGDSMDLGGVPVLAVVALVVASVVFLTEIMSNAATTAVFLPVLAGISKAGEFHPYLLMVPATIAASCAFMLPSGTGPNASVLASGQLTIPQMARAGLGLNILSIVVIVTLLYFIILPFFNITSTPPAWM